MKNHVTESDRNALRILAIILLSLLVHSLFFLLLSLTTDTPFRFLPSHVATTLFEEPDQQTPQNSPIAQNQEEQRMEIANRKAGKSDFGAPVIVQEDETSQETQEQSEKFTDQTSPVTHEKIQEIESTTKTVEDNIVEQQTQQPHTQSEEAIAEPSAPKTLAPTSLFYDETIPVAEPIIKSSTTPKKIVTSTSAKKQTQKKSPSAQEPFSLAKLAQGFLEYTKGTGNSPIEVQGTHDGPPSDEQLKHERYWQKIGWWIQKTSKMNSFLYRDLPNAYARTAWHMVLKRDGTINHLALMQSSGNAMVDAALEQIIKEASSSFPPVPNYFSGDFYVMRFTLYYQPYEQQQQSFNFNRR